MSIISRFSKQIYYSPKEMDLTQEQTAEALNISVRWFQDIENGKHSAEHRTNAQNHSVFRHRWKET